MEDSGTFIIKLLDTVRREHSSWESNVECKDPAQETSEGNNIRNLARDSSCDILPENEAGFCPCTKNQLETKLESLGLSSLVKEISGEPNIDSDVWL